MGGKRPDQYRIDEREAGATDYKLRVKHPDEGNREDRRFSEVMEGTVKRQQPIPPRTPEPESSRARDDEMAREEHIHQRRSRKARRASRRRGSRP